MNRYNLIWLACPAILASMLLVANSAHATEAVTQAIDIEVPAPATATFEVVFEQQTPEAPMLEFTDQESDEAIDRYGCDCSSCLNALRQLQGKLPLL